MLMGNKRFRNHAMQAQQDKEDGIVNTQVLPEIVISTEHKEKNPVTNTIAKGYKWLNSHPYLQTAYDGVNAGLYIASAFPLVAPVTLPLAYTMTGIQAAGAAADAYETGFNENNMIDLASAIPGFGLTEKAINREAKQLLKQQGKTNKHAKHFTKYIPREEHNIITTSRGSTFDLGKSYPTWYQAAMQNSRYAPAAVAIYGEDLLNNGLNAYQIYSDVVESKKTGGQFKFPKSKVLRTEEEMQKRDLRKNLVNNSRPDYIKKARIPNRIKKGENGLKFNEFKAVQPTNRFTYESNSINPDLKINTDQYSDFANYKSIDQIQQELKQKRETTIQVPETNYSSMSLEQLIEQENLPIKIVSSHRPGSMTKSGNTSHHSELDEYGNSRAYDIQPMFDGKIDKSDIGFKRLTDIIINNANARKWFQSHGFGILDETNASMMERTGATGKHFHIGPDKIAISNWNKLTNNGG